MKYLPKFVANFSFAWRILIWSQNSTCHRISTNTIFIKCDKIPSWFQYWTGGYVICTHWNVFNCLFDFSYQWLFKTFHIWLKWISSKLNSKPCLAFLNSKLHFNINSSWNNLKLIGLKWFIVTFGINKSVCVCAWVCNWLT